MKRILALFLVMMSIVLPSIAQNSQERSKLKVIELDLRAGTQKPTMVCHTCWAKNICGGCARLSFYDPEKKEYSHTPIESKCSDFKRIVESVLLKICEVRKNSELWKDLLTRVNTSNN